MHNLEIIYGKNLVNELSESDVFLRLNRVDAYGVSIVEAMCLRIPCLVTNVCSRPSGAIVFSNYDLLFAKLSEVIECNRADRLKYLDGFELPLHHEKLINIYKDQVKK